MKSLYLAEWETFIRYHEISGKGTTLVYLPGLCMPSAEQFLPVVTHADMAGYHALLIDYIGSGCSDHCPEFDCSVENHARAIAAVLDYEGKEGCTIIGHSMGGTVGIMLSILRPDLVSQLIVAEANISPGGGQATRRITSCSQKEYIDQAHQNFLDEMVAAEREGDALATFIHQAWHRADPAAIYKSSVALVELDTTFKTLFQKLAIPCTFIYGERSLPDDHHNARPDAPDPEELKKYDIQIAIVPDAGHVMMFDNLTGFVDVLKDAIRS